MGHLEELFPDAFASGAVEVAVFQGHRDSAQESRVYHWTFSFCFLEFRSQLEKNAYRSIGPASVSHDQFGTPTPTRPTSLTRFVVRNFERRKSTSINQSDTWMKYKFVPARRNGTRAYGERLRPRSSARGHGFRDSQGRHRPRPEAPLPSIAIPNKVKATSKLIDRAQF
jgi:hypothetical protein